MNCSVLFRSVPVVATLLSSIVIADDWPQWMGPHRNDEWTETGIVTAILPVFLTITEPGQIKVVASGFLYHALANTTASQRKYESGTSRNNNQVLGCLQGQLSEALVRYNTISDPAEAWAVITEGSTGGDIHNSYYATYDNNGVWS